MKTVKLDFCGFWSSFNKNENLFTRILSKHFRVEISDEPDFVICSNRSEPFEYMKYDCVRIMFMGENLSPDFTVFDYCIGFDYLEFEDRYFRLPLVFYFDNNKPWIPKQLTAEEAREILQNKQHFCNFIYGHPSSNGMRELLMEKLGAYKQVVSPGSYLNNLPGNDKQPKRCSWAEKHVYLRKSKFTIAADSICYPGFVTEKILQPFQRHSIPIYCGSPRIDEDFNPAAFVHCEGPADVDRAVKEVEYLDTHDDAYLDMLMQCPLHEERAMEKLYAQLEAFLVHIFEQDPDMAGRRIRYFCAAQHEGYLKDYARREARTPKVVKRIKSYLKR